MTPCEIASQAAHAIAVLNELTHGGGELSNPGDVRAIVGSLELIGQSLPQLYEQLARFLVVQHEDGQLTHEDGRDADDSVTEVIEALAAAGPGRGHDDRRAHRGARRDAGAHARQAPRLGRPARTRASWPGGGYDGRGASRTRRRRPRRCARSPA